MPAPMTPVPPWSQPPPSQPPQESDGAEADLFDYAKLRDYLVYFLHALSRRRLVVLASFAAVVTGAGILIVVVPRSYHCEIKIRAERNVVIGTLAGMTQSWDFELPTRAAADLITGHDNLVAVVRSVDLVHAWENNRAPILRLKDGIAKRLTGEMSPEAKEELAIDALEQRLGVQTTEDTVSIGVDWPDARTAYQIIRTAHENFLEARQYKEVSAVSEAIGLLQNRALDARDKVQAALERVYKLRGETPRKKKPGSSAPAPSRASAASQDPDLKRMRSQLQSKRQIISDMEEFRRRRIAEVASKLAELKQVYSEFHPAVIELQQQLQQQEKEENPQLALLRDEYRQLEEEYERRGGPAFEESAPETLSSASLPAEALQIGRSASEEVESPEVEQAKADLKFEIGRFSSLMQKIDGARLELDTQKAAFRYRYGVLRPAALPTTADKPKRRMVMIAGAVLGLFLGMALAVLLDFRSGILLERWQVERQLGLQVLGEVGGR